MNPLLIPLDVATVAEATALADRLRGAVGGFKIGKQLFTSTGPEIVRTLVARGDRVFLDLKFHDIPNTVAGASAAAAALGVWMFNVHASGGAAMMTAARTAVDRAAGPGGATPLVVAVTVLTSLDADTLRAVGFERDPLDLAVRLAKLAQASGLDGVVASPRETAAIRAACGPEFVIVTPGIRGGGAASGPDDQQRTLTPADAIRAGSSFLVVGRPITAAADPKAAAAAIAAEAAAAAT